VAGSLFITGARGFIGRRLLARLHPGRYDHIYCLSRESMNTGTSPATNLTWLEGSLFNSDRYAHCLNSSVTVVHLAATTGKAPVEEYFSVNRDGTQHLLMRCGEKKVKKFLHVSSIAANYRDKSHYYYAQSKLEAEEIVRKSGLGYAIVRPTIVLGRESSGWKSLARLARLPWVPVFGDGSTRIQPIEVDDLVDAMIAVIEESEFHNESFDLGGPDVLTIEEFLVKVHRLYCHAEPKVVHLPYQPVKGALSLAEGYFSSILPLNAGQLSVFVQDGTIAANRLYAQQRPRMKNIDTVLRLLVQ
jgi:nucleoside-diphosphate-sugar epimerase